MLCHSCNTDLNKQLRLKKIKFKPEKLVKALLDWTNNDNIGLIGQSNLNIWNSEGCEAAFNSVEIGLYDVECCECDRAITERRRIAVDREAPVSYNLSTDPSESEK